VVTYMRTCLTKLIDKHGIMWLGSKESISLREIRLTFEFQSYSFNASCSSCNHCLSVRLLKVPLYGLKSGSQLDDDIATVGDLREMSFGFVSSPKVWRKIVDSNKVGK
jgi:hypothetical protein